MSGYDFVPAWLVNWHRGNMFTDPGAIAAEAALVRAHADRLRDIPGFGGLTLGNETNQFSDGPNPGKMPATPEQISHWLNSTIGDVSR